MAHIFNKDPNYFRKKKKKTSLVRVPEALNPKAEAKEQKSWEG